jgi:alkanesulfonate monooxygenase SsuD/methylene tetrahydromethanopterin reductase-like flavin-dependent oxidoreductase (luciferase family)
MHVGIGLPINDPEALTGWARRADAGPFHSLGLLDRLVYGNPEPLITLAALASVTERIRLQTEVLLAPLHKPALLAKQCATLDRLSGGRFTLGVGVGTRPDDYEVAGVDFHRRGRVLDEQLPILRGIWAGDSAIGPRPAGPEVLFGGFAQAVIDRVARWGDGFLGAALPPKYLDGLFRKVEQAWADAGRAGRPRLVAQTNVAVGPAPMIDEARRELRAYYGEAEYTEHAVAGMLTTPEQIRDALSAFADIGADEVMLYCWASDAGQLDRIADLIG